ncbi:MAG: DUF2318 domain-containing protein [Deltaproteobacteria bacterium]|jgi:uncharacterized membrane protein|nr:DUF2318 domain-containing protein [Deltaproteobacteria bacterium]
MLLYFLSVLDSAWPMAVALALIFTVLFGLKEFDRGHGYRRLVWLGWLVGFLAALTLAILRRQTGWVVREFYDLGVLCPLTLTLLAWLVVYPTPERRMTASSPWTLFLGAGLVALWTALGTPNLLLYPLDFGVGLDSVFNVDYLAKVGGYSLGLVLLLTLALGLAAQAQTVPRKLLRGFLLVSFLSLLALVILKTSQIMIVRGMLPDPRKLTEKVASFYLSWRYFFLGGAIIIGGALVLAQKFRPRLAKPSQAQPALTRENLGLGFWLAGAALIALAISVEIAVFLLNRSLIPNYRNMTSWVVFFLERENYFLYAQIIIWGALAITQMVRSRLVKPQGANPALIRKIRSELKTQFSLGILIVITLSASLFSVTIIKDYHSRGPQIDDPLAVKAIGDQIELDLSVVGDGQLHRRSFVTESGTVVRFIVIRKSDTAYGVGLDACDICGQTGYYQRGDQVICKLCDVVMNKVTIGFPGGCNPVPLDFKVEPGKIVIKTRNLEKEKRRFE